MPIIFENPHLQLRLDPAQSIWGLTGRRERDIGFDGARLNFHYHLDGRPSAPVTIREIGAAMLQESGVSPHGPLQSIHLGTVPDRNGISLSVSFSLPEDLPFVFWRMTVHNNGPQPIFLDRLVLLDLRDRLSRGTGGAGTAIHNLKSPAFFSNGWQSWSHAGAYRPGERFIRTRLGPLRAPTDVNAGTPQPGRPGRFASDFFGLLGDLESRCALLAGFLSQRQNFGSLEVSLSALTTDLEMWANGDSARLDPRESFTTDWACLGCLNIDGIDPIGPYVEAVGREHGLLPPLAEITAEDIVGSQAASPLKQAIPTGWCSWYQYSSSNYIGDLNEVDIRQNLAASKSLKRRLPLDLFQIDDGFESQVGDWFSFASGFPTGVAGLAAEIRSSGLTPGLWLAPFIVHPASRLARERPGWLLRSRFGRPVNAGFLWNSFTTALDLTHPGAREYAAKVVGVAARDWGYRYIKLDFLYAAALPGQHNDPTRTRAQILRQGLEALRESAGEKVFLLGCSCPLGSAVGLVDAMRIGADTARRWLPYFPRLRKVIRKEPNLPSARNALHNALTRAAFHGRWWINDPDCLLLNPGEEMTLDEVRTSATVIALSGGSLILSDDLASLPLELLEIAGALLPPIGKRPQVLDWFDKDPPQRLRLDLENSTGAWRLLALINWADQPQELVFYLEEFDLDPQASYLAREFWNREYYSILDGRLSFPDVPAHATRLLAVRPLQAMTPTYLGSDLHISQGLEVTDWEPGTGDLRICLKRPGPSNGEILLSLPAEPLEARIDSRPLQWEKTARDIFRFPLVFDQVTEIYIAW